MKCLVFSDSHGDTAYIRRAILKHKDAEVLFFLGDGLFDFDEVASREFSGAIFKVKGNCDYGYSSYDSSVKKTDEIVLLDKRIVFLAGLVVVSILETNSIFTGEILSDII